MTEESNLEASLARAQQFLNPVLRRDALQRARGASLIDRLAGDLDVDIQPDELKREKVIDNALHLALAIHYAAAASLNSNEILHNSENSRVIDALLDLISLEGVYPSLSAGVGIPVERRVKSILPKGVIAKPMTADSKGGQNNKNYGLLRTIIENITSIYGEKNKGLETFVRDRILIDVVSACGELAFGPSTTDNSGIEKYKYLFYMLLDETPTSTVLPLLMSLLHPATPSWLKPHVSHPLSLIPLRPDGVRQTVYLISSAIPTSTQPTAPPSNTTPTPKPTIPIEALTQSAKLLGSVPKSTTPQAYFDALSPQLWKMLNDPDPELRKAAAFIIGNGILGRRSNGAPGTIGWTLFAEPFFRKLNPTIQSSSTDIISPKSIVVSSTDLKTALKNLHTLILSHPNPGVTKRLIDPLLLPLWAVMCTVKEEGKASTSELYEQSSSLIQTYFKLSAGAEQLIRLSDKILWDGEDGKGAWVIAKADGSDEVCVRLRESRGHAGAVDMVEMMARIDLRVEEFVKLVDSSFLDDESIGKLFLTLSKKWLLDIPSSTSKSQNKRLEIGHDEEDTKDPMSSLISAKLVLKMINPYKDKISSNPIQLLELINQLLESFIDDLSRRQAAQEIRAHSIIASLSNIVADSNKEASKDQETTEESASVAFSILSTLLSSPSFNPDSGTKALLELIQPKVHTTQTSSLKISSSLKLSASNTAFLLELALASSEQKPSPPTIPSKKASDLKTHKQALSYLSDPLPPVRAQGLTILTHLIKSHSTILDIPSTFILLVSTLQDEDEFIYLNSIKALSALSTNHPKTVIRMLVEHYVDKDEEMGLDQRLRLGEALLKTVEGMDEALVGEPAKILGEAMLATAGRRGYRPKAFSEQQKRFLARQAKHKEAAEAWGGSVPQLGEDEENNEDEQQNEYISRIVSGWEDRKGEEDVRIRASALTILGTAIETNIAGLGSNIISTGIDMSISILTLEKDPSQAILRRAAILLIMSLIKTLDKAEEHGKKLGFGLAGENLAEIIRVLRYVEGADGDDMVKENTSAVIESLENWQAKSLLVGLSMQDSEMGGPNVELAGGRLAGLAVDPSGGDGSLKPRIEEIE